MRFAPSPSLILQASSIYVVTCTRAVIVEWCKPRYVFSWLERMMIHCMH